MWHWLCSVQCVRNGLWPVFYFKVNIVDLIKQASLTLRRDVFERFHVSGPVGNGYSEQKSLRKEMSAMHFNVWQPITEKEIFLILIWVVKETRTEQELCIRNETICRRHVTRKINLVICHFYWIRITYTKRFEVTLEYLRLATLFYVFADDIKSQKSARSPHCYLVCSSSRMRWQRI